MERTMALVEIDLGVVRVKLTECGRKMLEEKGERPRTEDVNGWSKWYFWDLMSVFGKKYLPGDELPFDFTMLAEGTERPPHGS